MVVIVVVVVVVVVIDLKKNDHICKWYLHKQESTLENETHKILWDFEIQTDHRIIPSRRPSVN